MRLHEDSTTGNVFRRSAPVSYRRALEIQERLVAKRREGLVPDLAWFLEHTPTITFGTAGGEEHLLLSAEELRRRGYEVHATRRGGDVTCHEPGQLVVYPVVDLGRGSGARDLHLYLRRLEEAVIGWLASYGLEGGRVEGRTGVWLDGRPARKIAAIGVRCARWITSHGLALNVENSLEGFGFIVPCGIRDGGVTSLRREIETPIEGGELRRRLHELLEDTLERPLVRVEGEEAADL